MTHKSDSYVQRSVEAEIARALSMRERVSLAPAKLTLRNGATVNIDGFDPKAHVLCEIYAHVGKTRGSQPGKIAKDMLKLVAAEKSLGRKHRKIICFADKVAAACVRGKSWLAEVARDLGVEVISLELPPKTTASIRAAQEVQAMVNR